MTGNSLAKPAGGTPAITGAPISAPLLVTDQERAEALVKALAMDDLGKLTTQEQLAYYIEVCRSVGVNPATKPFGFLEVQGEGSEKRIILYCKRDGADQLRKLHRITIEIKDRKLNPALGIYSVTVRAHSPIADRWDEDDGIVEISKEKGTWGTAKNDDGTIIKKKDGSPKRVFTPDPSGERTPLMGKDLALAMLKAVTIAKRRVTLSICGLGCLSEEETDLLYDAERRPDLEPQGMPVTENEDPEEKAKRINTIQELRDQIGLTNAQLKEKALELTGKATSELMSLQELDAVINYLKELDKSTQGGE